MKILDISLPSPAENLALDEALLNTFDRQPDDVLRLWQPRSPMVVLGRASRYREEVNQNYCDLHSVPLLRRCSGGASIVASSGCLMYAVVLGLQRHPDLRLIERAHEFVLSRTVEMLRQIGVVATVQGTSDLTVGNRKFSGNSLRCKRDAILYHGTILCSADIGLISRCLLTAPKQPEYRQQRDHDEFLANLGKPVSLVKRALIEGWQADEELAEWPREETDQLVRERYSTDDWNLRH